MSDPSQASDGIADCCPGCGIEVTFEPLDSAGDSPCPECGQVLWFVERNVDDAVVLTFLPGLMIASESERRIDEVLSAFAGTSFAIINLSHLQILTSIFLGMLVALHRRVQSADGTLKICGLQPEVREVFRMTRLDGMLMICDDEQSALESS